MKNIVPKDSRYIPFTQQRSCCVPTCMSMIMYKLNIPLIPQELLGYHLGLIVDKENKFLFWNVRSGKKPPAGYGTKILDPRFNPNKVFKKLKIPLEIIIYPIESFKGKDDFIKFIADGVKKDRNFIVCFNHGTLNRVDKKGGHVCVIDRIYPLKNKIRLIDPSPVRPKWRIVNITTLLKAIKFHPANKGGIWELRKTK